MEDTGTVTTTKLTRAEIKGYRESALEEQGGICPLCETEIALEDSALDHCHKQGNVRMVLHRWCNAVLGRVENWSNRVGKTDNLTFLKNTVKYLEMSHTDILHPTHGVPRKRKKRTTTKRKRKPTVKRQSGKG